MAENVNQLDTAADDAIEKLERLIVETEILENAQILYPVEISRNDPPENYREQIYEFTLGIRALQLMKVQHKFLKISDAERDRRLARYETIEGNVSTDVETIKHTVRPFDSFESLALELGLDWKEIARHNDILPKDLVAGMIIEIPLKVDFEAPPIATNPVFDSHVGQKALGRDLPNELTVDSNGDLEVLDYRDTFIQGLSNTVTTEKGEFIEDPGFGFDPGVGEDIPTDLTEEWIKKDLQSVLRQDPRVAGVPLGEMVVDKTGEQTIYKIQVQPIRTVGYEEVTATR